MINFKDPIIASLVGGILGIIFLYINSYITKKKQDNINYLKQFILVAGIVYFILYMNDTNLSIKNTTIHTGNPNF